MSAKTKVLFHAGGLEVHPVESQARMVADWLDDGYIVEPVIGDALFGRLDEADLVVVGGLFWTESQDINWAAAYPYVSPGEADRQAWRDYVASGRPVCGFHGGIASYNDWPEFGRLLGFSWVWGFTSHSRVDPWSVEIAAGDHPITNGLEPYTITDELYYNVVPKTDIGLCVHATADYHGIALPMLMTGQGGRVPGAGRTAYIANGHDMTAFKCSAMPRIFRNTFDWLVQDV